MTDAIARHRSGDYSWESTLLAALPSPVFLLGPDDQFLYANEAAEAFFAAPRSLLLKSVLRQRLPASDPLFDLISRVRREGRSLQLDGGGVRLDPASRYDGVSMVPLSGDMLIMLRIPSQAGAATHAGAPLATTRALADIAAFLAHEIKNPLAGIKGAAQLIGANLTEADQRMTRLIVSEVDRIRALVERLEILSDPGPLHREAVNIHRILDDCLQLTIGTAVEGLDVVRLFDPSLPAVWGNEDLLRQIFLNLLKNAQEALSLSDGGNIVITTAYRHGIRPRAAQTGFPSIAISIADNGPGLPPERTEAPFRPYLSHKPGGRGLGLALTAKIVAELNGTIDHRRDGDHTVFTVLLQQAPEKKS